MGNNKIAGVLSIIFILTFGLAVVGFMNKDKYNNNNNTDNTPKSNIEVVEYTDGNKAINGLDSILSGVELTKANKDYNSENMNVTINGNEIKFVIKRDGLSSPAENDPESFEYTVKEISNPIAIQADLTRQVGDIVYAYVLDNNNMLYFITFKADPHSHNGISVRKYNVIDVESFGIFHANLDETAANDISYVIFKTADGSYYTDYYFDESSTLTITRIENETNTNVEVPTPEDNNTEASNTENNSEEGESVDSSNAEVEQTPAE